VFWRPRGAQRSKEGGRGPHGGRNERCGWPAILHFRAEESQAFRGFQCEAIVDPLYAGAIHKFRTSFPEVRSSSAQINMYGGTGRAGHKMDGQKDKTDREKNACNHGYPGL